MKRRPGLRLCFLAYCGIMIWLLFIHGRAGAASPGAYWEQVRQNINLIPFHTIRGYFYLLGTSSRVDHLTYAVVNLFGNLLVFVPWGIFVPCLWQRYRRFGRFLLLSAAVIAAVEAAQLFTLLGKCDIDDLLLNLPGMSMGFALYAAAGGKKKSAKK